MGHTLSKKATGVMHGQLVGLSGTKPGPLLHNSIQVRHSRDEHEQAPGFIEAMTDIEARLPFPLVGFDTDNAASASTAATTKAIDWQSNKHGKKTRIHDKPHTTHQRVPDPRILTAGKAAEPIPLFEPQTRPR